MNIKIYTNRIPDKWIIKDSFFDRYPNLSYLVTYGTENMRSILIDACVNIRELEHDLTRLGSKLEWILLTHTHLDHCFRLPEILSKYNDASIGIHSRGLKNTFPNIPGDKFVELTSGVDTLIGDDCLIALSTPGHTGDSICYWDKKNSLFFSGDILLGGEIGCCDYHSGGDRDVFYQTINYLLQLLPAATRIFPAHRLNHYLDLPPYLWSRELEKNPYLRYAAAGDKEKFEKALQNLYEYHEPEK